MDIGVTQYCRRQPVTVNTVCILAFQAMSTFTIIREWRRAAEGGGGGGGASGGWVETGEGRRRGKGGLATGEGGDGGNEQRRVRSEHEQLSGQS